MENIFHRVSIRKYQDKSVEKEKIIQILRAGMQAPSACNQQPWEFYVVTDREKIRKACQSDSVFRLCSRSSGSDCSSISDKGAGCAGDGTDRHVHCTGKYLARDRCAGIRWRLDRDCADAGPNELCTRSFGYSGRSGSIFVVCDGISGGEQKTAGSVRWDEDSFCREVVLPGGGEILL